MLIQQAESLTEELEERTAMDTRNFAWFKQQYEQLRQLQEDYVDLQASNKPAPHSDVATQTVDNPPPVMMDSATLTNEELYSDTAI